MLSPSDAHPLHPSKSQADPAEDFVCVNPGIVGGRAVLLPSQADSPVIVPSFAEEKKLYYQNLMDTADTIPVEKGVNILTHITQLYSARAQVAAHISSASLKEPSAGDYAWLYQHLYKTLVFCIKVRFHPGFSKLQAQTARFVIDLEKNLEERKKQTKEFLDKCIQQEWDKQCSLEGLLHAGGEGGVILDAEAGGHTASSSCEPSTADANADLIARLSACLDDDDHPPPPAPSSTSSASLPAAPPVPLPLSVQPPVSALEPFPAPLTPAQLQTSSKIFSSWKDFSPHRMRSVIIPHQAIDAFMFAARGNTSRNVETCAILGGVQSGDSLVISTVIVPQQKGNSDYCEAAGEEHVLDTVLSKNLIVIGWIHTHPTQDAFLSSIDMHMHCSYQSSLPEAVAIVMAPSKAINMGIFRLTTPPGLDNIRNCRLSGFHPHDADPRGALFSSCAHARVDAVLSVELVDQR